MLAQRDKEDLEILQEKLNLTEQDLKNTGEKLKAANHEYNSAKRRILKVR
jgi:hypothetical protein